MQATSGLSPAPSVADGPPVAGVTPPVASQSGIAAPPAPAAPSALSAGSSMLNTMQTGMTADQRAQALVDKLTDIQKQQLMTTGVQALAGFGGGIMEGLTAEDKIALDRLINSQNEAQRQYLNANNAYAPSLKFDEVAPRTGLIAQRRS
jgi:alkylated DNA nucleotide flippase Atl1